MRNLPTLALTLAVASQTACMSLGIDRLTPDQIKATEGLITCVQIATTYGRGAQVTINADDIRKGATSKSKISMTPDCAVTVETDVAPAPAPAPAK